MSGPDALQVASGASPQQVQALLKEFGSPPQVLAASPAARDRFVRPAAAGRLALARDLALRRLRAPLKERPVISSWSAVATELEVAGRLSRRARMLQAIVEDHH